MTARHALTLLFAGAACTAGAGAYPDGTRETPGELVSVSVEVDGTPAPLYRAPNHNGRFYLEARQGCAYGVTLSNHSGERLGVVLMVDGLNVISGEPDRARGRMYVLDPWQQTTVRGWRSSLQDVRAFTFVDEKASYATRSGKANAKMGWIEMAVYRERHRPVVHDIESRPPLVRQRAEAPASAPAGVESSDGARRTQEKAARAEAQDVSGMGAEARSYPGTGWGRRTHDPVVLVSFEPESQPCETVTLRYEYRPALVALGVLPSRTPQRGRLWQRDHAESGFAQPPLW